MSIDAGPIGESSDPAFSSDSGRVIGSRGNAAMMRRMQRIVPSRRGSAIIDVIAASILTAMVLVPSTEVMRRSLKLDRRLLLRQDIVTRCRDLIEQEISMSTSSSQGVATYDIDGASICHTANRSDALADGGIPGQLAAVVVTVWHDANENRRLEPTESSYSLATKVAIQ